MGFFFEASSLEAFLLLSAVIILIINYFNHTYSYWEKNGVPTIKPHFPLGNTNSFLPKGFSVGTVSKNYYDELKGNGHKFGGVYLLTTPNLVIVDPDYIKDIMCKDFQHFVDRGIYYNKKNDPLSAHLFMMDGYDWKNMRVKLTPTFTSGKIKAMFHSVVECCNYMEEAILGNVNKDLDIKEMLGRFTTDVIGTCAFGIECNSFKHPDAEFRTMGKRIFEYNWWVSLRAFFLMNTPKLALQLGLKSTVCDVRNFFTKIVANTVKIRQENNIKRNDFLQLLINLNLDLIEITAQVYLFFIAGFETSSTAMTFGLYELARNPHIQKKLRQEINEVVEHDGALTYENIKNMKYLSQVIDETLRMYPSVTTLNRRCTKDYTLRDTNITIQAGTPVLISTLGLHMDPEFYPEPEKFDPDRFSDENKKERRSFVYLPFGDGPRNCIGLRFGLMQTKIGIATLVKNFNLTLSPTMKPVKFDPLPFLLNSIEKVYLRAEKI